MITWTHGDVQRLADRLRAAHALVRLHPGDREFTDPFHRAFRALFSPEWESTVDALRAGDAAAVEPVIVFLEVDPRCHRSGYEKERLCPLLARVPLTDEQRTRLLAVTDAVLADAERPQRERTRYQRLALQLASGAR